ncbi:MAG TPA: hypothetical protein VF796_30985, partial [Humisphaera sp.]
MPPPALPQQGSRIGLIIALIVFVILWGATTFFWFQERGLREKAERDAKEEPKKWEGVIDGTSPADDAKVQELKQIVASGKYPEAKSVVGVLDHEIELLITATGVNPKALSAAPTTNPAAPAATDVRPAERVAAYLKDGLLTYRGILQYGTEAEYDNARKGGPSTQPATAAVDDATLTKLLPHTEGDVIGPLKQIAAEYVALAKASKADKARADAEIAKLRADLTTESGKVAGLDSQVKAANEAVAKFTADRSVETLNTLVSDQRKVFDGAKGQQNRELEDAIKAKNDAESRIAALQGEVAKAQAKVAPLMEYLKQYRMNVEDNVIRRADGYIVSTNNDGTVIINLGSTHHVAVGMTFEVFDGKRGVPGLNADIQQFEDAVHMRGGGDKGAGAMAAADRGSATGVGLALSKSGAKADPSKFDTLPLGPKGSIEIISVGNGGNSLCRIFRTEPGQTIKQGDVIANLVYDPNIKFKFAVIGAFDIDYDGRSRSSDTQFIRRLIEQWGGIVQPAKT